MKEIPVYAKKSGGQNGAVFYRLPFMRFSSAELDRFFYGTENGARDIVEWGTP